MLYQKEEKVNPTKKNHMDIKVPCFLNFKTCNDTNNTSVPRLQEAQTKIKNKCPDKINESIILQHNNTSPQVKKQSPGPTKCHAAIGGAQPSCIEPTLITIQFSCLWITKKSPQRS
jgi:hypothetical protein